MGSFLPGVEAADPNAPRDLLHCKSLISLLDIHVIENRCGRIDNHIGTRGSDLDIAALQQNNWSHIMYASLMNILDRTAMIFVVVLAAMPILSIVARAAVL
jgi:hypothetical protein